MNIEDKVTIIKNTLRSIPRGVEGLLTLGNMLTPIINSKKSDEDKHAELDGIHINIIELGYENQRAQIHSRISELKNEISALKKNMPTESEQFELQAKVKPLEAQVRDLTEQYQHTRTLQQRDINQITG